MCDGQTGRARGALGRRCLDMNMSEWRNGAMIGFLDAHPARNVCHVLRDKPRMDEDCRAQRSQRAQRSEFVDRTLRPLRTSREATGVTQASNGLNSLFRSMKTPT